MLSCVFCNVKLLYPRNVPVDHRERTAALFSGQLVSRHLAHCPWSKVSQCVGVCVANTTSHFPLVWTIQREPSPASPGALQVRCATSLLVHRWDEEPPAAGGGGSGAPGETESQGELACCEQRAQRLMVRG